MEMGQDVGERGQRKVVQVDELTSNKTLSINKVYLTYTTSRFEDSTATFTLGPVQSTCGLVVFHLVCLRLPHK